MKRIEFRGRKSNGEWIYGNLVDAGNDEAYICSSLETTPAVNLGEYVIINGQRVEPATVTQFTGLYDNAGIKIYEGDILESVSIDSGEILRSIVGIGNCYDDDAETCYGFWLKWDKEKNIFYKEYLPYVKVVGNIYDNPELVNEGQ